MNVTVTAKNIIIYFWSTQQKTLRYNSFTDDGNLF